MRRILNTALLALSCFTASATTFGQEKGGDAKTASATLTFAEDALTLVTPDTWKQMPPKSTVIQHEFRVPATGDAFARITFSISGGSVQNNIDRWVGQFDGAKKDDIKMEKKDIGSTVVHMVDITGTYKESMGGGPFAPGPMKKLENHRMLGAIIELKSGTRVYVKATGAKDLIESTKPAFVKMVEGLKTK
ncbi:hypothetical protein VN12_09375 [Pirellula sp. SH-Sr6A]|uniref:hypothetical protein n=1 Tax=Pirellula sp. SH-Sr6A TaxID=1632865 RepID=UPI00078B38D1|nr:hypothetical protein [Pirellula sp. SH-Sr6A]AMV32322.1 hypothetical protein VN12_09375 [Pirellula sp. SH-Sr6A]